MALPRHRGRAQFTLGLLILTAVTLLTLDARGFAPVDVARERTLSALSPVDSASSAVFDPVGDLWNGVWRYGDLDEENARLQARIDELEGQQSMGEISEQALRDFLNEADIAWVSDTETEIAKVVSGPVTNFDHTVTISKGSSQGISEGMAVVTGRGLVGRTIRVSEDRSVVQLITDPQVTMGVRLRSGEVGTATGQGSGEPLHMVGVEQTATVVDGELVYTATFDRGLFPGDIPVGRVARVDDNPGDPSKSLMVEPLARLDDLSYVTVLLQEPER